MIRVAIYARVSTTEQNPEAQLLTLREFAVNRGFEIYKEYVDYVSGVIQRWFWQLDLAHFGTFIWPTSQTEFSLRL